MAQLPSPAQAQRARGLFINSPAGQCSIHESGRMFYAAICESDRYSLDYAEHARIEEIPRDYDFYAFNYHLFTMPRLDTRRVRELPGLKLTFVLEVAPGDPFILCPDHFDAYCVVDPSIDLGDPRVYAFPRPLSVPECLPEYEDRGIPVIGSFGFATPGKNFHRIVRAAGEEFERAIVRLHVPIASHADPKGERAQEMVDQCRAELRPGIELQVSHEYLGDAELIAWCAQNTLNCFFYERKIPGLAATVDQAVMAGRPVLVSECATFRHIHPYVGPFPQVSMREAIELGKEGVQAMQRDWSKAAFGERFVQVLEGQGLLVADKKREKVRIIEAPPAREGELLFLNHSAENCGIQQYGAAIAGVLEKSSRYRVHYREVDDASEFYRACGELRPELVIYNYGIATMPWLNSSVIHGVPARHLGILHEFREEHLNGLCGDLFDHWVVGDGRQEPINPFVSHTGRLIPEYQSELEEQEIPSFGSFGFGFEDKGFERLVARVNAEFDAAIVRLHMPRSHFSDPSGDRAQACIERCRQEISKPGIQLEISDRFLSLPDLLRFLAGNSLNAFFYDESKNVGISSCPDLALAVGRPLAVNRCPMFRHLHHIEPSICIEDRSLRQILDSGIEPLTALRRSWRADRIRQEYEGILDRLLGRLPAMSLEGVL
ncbi:MAG: hypothetical protein ACYTG5_02270 [Planctomycetota bacterium]|jgi:hypothetical protein